MKAKTRNIGVAVCLLLVWGCSSISYHHDFDRDADFTSYKTFGWMEQPAPAGGGARVAEERNPLVEKRIKVSVDRQLIEKGLRRVNTNPDLWVAYYTGYQDKIDVTDYGYRYSMDYWGYGGRQIDVYQYQEGTLIIDLIDSKAQELVWRGSATGTVDSNPSPEKIEKKINEVVANMFRSYPPSGN